jgi:hypothetical protein
MNHKTLKPSLAELDKAVDKIIVSCQDPISGFFPPRTTMNTYGQDHMIRIRV